MYGIADVQKVNAARKKWEERLIDKSRNNNLLYFRELRVGTLNLNAVDPAALRRLMSGAKVASDDFVQADAGATEMRNRIGALHKRALQNLEEKGLATLYVAAGMATWQTADGGRGPAAPVLLLPAKIEVKGRSQTLQLTGDRKVNLALLHVLQTEFGCVISEEMLLGENEEQEIAPPVEDVSRALTTLVTTAENPVFVRLRSAAQKVPGFDIFSTYVLGNFSFQKMSMVRDIREYGEQIAAHPVLAAIAGVEHAGDALRRERRTIDVKSLDRIAPDAEFLVLDADSSQQRVVTEASQPQSGVVQGPPGTGKSQTIVNLIATLAAQGKRVLFVAEKRAALQVVQDRMARIGLDHLVLDLHGAEISSREILQRINVRLDSVRETLAVQPLAVHGVFAERRMRLNVHAHEVNRRRSPQDRSVYELQGALLKLKDRPQTLARWRGAELVKLTPEGMDHLRSVIRDASGVAELFLRTSKSPWTNAQLDDAAVAQRALDTARALQSHLISDLRELLTEVCADLCVREPANVADAQVFASLLRDVQQTVERYALPVFAEPLDEMERVLAGVNTPMRRLWARLTNSAYRTMLTALRRHRRQPADDATLSADLLKLLNVSQRWRARAIDGAVLVMHDATNELVRCVTAAADAVAMLLNTLSKAGFEKMSWDELQTHVTALAGDERNALLLPRVRVMEAQAVELGAELFVRELKRMQIAPADWADALEHAVARSLLEQAFAETPDLTTFEGKVHDGYVADFRGADVQRTQLSIARVRRACAEHAVRVRNEFPDEAQLVKMQAQRSRGRLPLRELLARAPHVLTSLFPCWMASPLSISQLLRADQNIFDVVVFDEGSQILPEDAVPAILRAQHVIVAGDRHQLPPTTFFAAGVGDSGDESDDSDSVDGYESLLDQMSAVTETWSLDWHYRSRDEALIAFSNRHIYQDRLITFPGPFTGKAIRHELVTPEAVRDGEEDSVSAEVQRVVELVFEHARTRPDETLGVITMGIKHQQRVEAAIERALAAHPELEEFFDTQKTERFFVKNIERVQGDERDAIIISVGYGKNADGRLVYRFGPLLTEGGERRLNVAVTRARNRLTLVSSFSHLDMDPGRSTKRGVELLRLYLEYAASNGRRVGRSVSEPVAPNPFEEDVQRALEQRGLKLLPQWGASGYRIDLVAQHPERPGEFVLAIECDGATYHSAATARDRDRLRQQVLESLGWRFHRIWSTDWFNEREHEIDRAVRAYDEALRVGASKPVELPKIEPVGERFEQSTKLVAPVVERSLLNLPKRASIDEYSDTELRGLLTWVRADGQLRDNAELFDAMFAQLPFKQRGSRIRERLERVITATPAS